MNTTEALEMARSLMDEHGLDEWKLELDQAKERAGQCDFMKRTISLSRHFVELNDETPIRDVTLHEIAHALAGKASGHGPAWKAKCEQVGANPAATYDDRVNMPPPRYTGTCPGCGATIRRHRRNPLSCGACSGGQWNPRFLFEWTED